MRRPSLKLIVTLLSIAAVGAVALKDMGRTAPGPLSAVHKGLPELEGWRSCAQCHGGLFGNLFGSMAESCLDCHEEIESSIADRSGVHGRISKEQAGHCAQCHSEHHGDSFAIVNSVSFALAGAGSREDFAHSKIGYAMQGKHLDLECKKCHENADKKVLAKGERRFLGLSQDCATCHDDPHEGRMRIACASCHGQTDFKELGSKGHEERLFLTGVHESASCRDCHAKGSANSLEAHGRDRSSKARACQDCHESPHAAGFVESFARSVGAEPRGSCVRCHGKDAGSFRNAGISSEQHAHSGFRLEEAHARLACDACHGTASMTYRERHPGRKQGDCRACHEDPHRSQFLNPTWRGKQCSTCHGGASFSPHEFTASMHEKTGMPLRGKHTEIDCHECHVEERRGGARRFAGTEGRCEDCHSDAHAGYFDRQLDLIQAPAEGTCAQCHGNDSFSGVSGFEHDRWTGFAVQGAHEEAGCEACHEPRPDKDESGRRFGSVREKHGRFRGCKTCHRDPHDGRFDKDPKLAALGGKRGCARCHGDLSFRSLPGGFQHGLWTGFRLDGAHAKADCSACHAPILTAQSNARSFEKAKGRLCSSCHESPHAGQFARRGKTDCARCHESAVSFSSLVFDHDKDARFKLDKAHSALSCDACHKDERRGKQVFVRYKPMKRSCADCHGMHEDPFNRRKRKRG